MTEYVVQTVKVTRERPFHIDGEIDRILDRMYGKNGDETWVVLVKVRTRE